MHYLVMARHPKTPKFWYFKLTVGYNDVRNVADYKLDEYMNKHFPDKDVKEVVIKLSTTKLKGFTRIDFHPTEHSKAMQVKFDTLEMFLCKASIITIFGFLPDVAYFKFE